MSHKRKITLMAAALSITWALLLGILGPELNKLFVIANGFMAFWVTRSGLRSIPEKGASRPKAHLILGLAGAFLVIGIALIIPVTAYLNVSRLPASRQYLPAELPDVFLSCLKQGKYDEARKLMSSDGISYKNFAFTLEEWKKFNSSSDPVFSWKETSTNYTNIMGGKSLNAHYEIVRKSGTARAVFVIESTFKTGASIKTVEITNGSDGRGGV